MKKMWRRRLVAALSALALIGGANSACGADLWEWLVSPELLEHSNLRAVWETTIPARETESVQRMLIIGDRLYMLSDSNYMIALGCEKGRLIFGKSVAPAGFVLMGLEPYDSELISVIGGRLTELEAMTGDELRAKSLEFGIVCPPARNREFFYVAGTDGRLHVFKADNMVEVFEVSADKPARINSILADEQSVILSTEAGSLISMAPDKPVKLWQFDTPEGIISPVVRDGRSLFFAGQDGYVYRVDIVNVMRNKLVWKCQMKGPLENSPRVTQRVVYQHAQGRGLTAIDIENGRAIWSLEEGADLLAETRGRAYVITSVNTLVVMDNNRAEKVCTVNFADVARYAVNTVDSRIYIADKAGRIACIKPVGR